MVSPALVIFGSGPGIGISVAKLFAEKHFDTIALLSRNAERLEFEKKQVEEAAKQVGRDVKVFAIPTDLSDRDGLRKSLKEVEKLGPLGLVLHNAARINPAPALTTSVEELEEDFRVSVAIVMLQRPQPLDTNVSSDRKSRVVHHCAMGSAASPEWRSFIAVLLRNEQPVSGATASVLRFVVDVKSEPAELADFLEPSVWRSHSFRCRQGDGPGCPRERSFEPTKHRQGDSGIL